MTPPDTTFANIYSLKTTAPRAQWAGAPAALQTVDIRPLRRRKSRDADANLQTRSEGESLTPAACGRSSSGGPPPPRVSSGTGARLTR
jgi:hypothetical protein